MNIQIPKILSLYFLRLQKKRFLPVILIVVVILIVATVVANIKVSDNSTTSNRVSISQAKAKATVEKEFSFPVVDSRGREITKLKYTIANAELRDEIIVQGKRAYAVEGRLFLIVSLKIVNEYDKGLEINARDYIRLSMNGKTDELIAPEIHNDPMVVQPISTKETRIGFGVSEKDKDYVLTVGEIKGEKTQIPLAFQ